MRAGSNAYLLGVEAAGDDVLGVLVAHVDALFERHLLPQELLVVGQLDDQRTVEGLLQPLGEEEGDQVA